MKKILFSAISLLWINFNCKSQNLDRLESAFETIPKNTAIPCQYEMAWKLKPNGKHYFINKDSTRLEIDWFRTPSLPFYDSQQTNLETVIAYYNWNLKEANNSERFSVEKIEENVEKGFIILKITDTQEEFYRLLSRNDESVCSIKIFDKTMALESQLDHLRVLYDLNRK